MPRQHYTPPRTQSRTARVAAWIGLLMTFGAIGAILVLGARP